jgi:hypothetical protein
MLSVSPNPFIRPVSERPDERKRALWQNPEVGFTGGAVHYLLFAFANGGSDLIGNSGRKTANVCDKHAKETTRNHCYTSHGGWFSSSFSGNRGAKFLKIFRKRAGEL